LGVAAGMAAGTERAGVCGVWPASERGLQFSWICKVHFRRLRWQPIGGRSAPSWVVEGILAIPRLEQPDLLLGFSHAPEYDPANQEAAASRTINPLSASPPPS